MRCSRLRVGLPGLAGALCWEWWAKPTLLLVCFHRRQQIDERRVGSPQLGEHVRL
jgi:hypothetical protein